MFANLTRKVRRSTARIIERVAEPHIAWGRSSARQRCAWHYLSSTKLLDGCI